MTYQKNSRKYLTYSMYQSIIYTDNLSSILIVIVPLAQLVEQLPLKQFVQGSSP